MELILTRLLALFVIACVVAIITRRFHLPYTVGLVLTGGALAIFGVSGGFELTHDLIFLVILPPLLFEAALGISWQEFRRDAVPILVLSTLGVVLSAAIVAFGMTKLLGWPLPAAAIFGTLIAATDPVAVIATFKDNRVNGRVRLLVESESLLNDGVAALLFGLVLAWAEGTSVAPDQALIDLGVTVGGGLLIGFATAIAVLTIAGRTADHFVETVLTTVAAYGSFLIAQQLHVSGILATISAGLVLGRAELLDVSKYKFFNSNVLTKSGQEFLESFWEFIAFLANSLIFLMIGLAVAGTNFDETAMSSVSVASLLVLVARALSVYGLCLPFTGTRWHIPLREQHVLWWGGLRGALALALVLALPKTLAYHREITIATFGVVAVSVIVQGLTMPALLKALGLLPNPKP